MVVRHGAAGGPRTADDLAGVDAVSLELLVTELEVETGAHGGEDAVHGVEVGVAVVVADGLATAVGVAAKAEH